MACLNHGWRTTMKALAVSLVLVPLLGEAGAYGQLVADGATTVLDGTTNLVEGDLTVGTNGALTTLILTNGAVVSNQLGYVGLSASAASNAVLVTGAGSLWTNSTRLTIGDAAAYNSLTVRDGGTVFSPTGIIGNQSGSEGNWATVSDPGSYWQNSLLAVGSNGAGSRLSVLNGGTVVSISGYMGRGQGSSNNSVLVSGTGSLWSNWGSIRIGEAGAWNTLTVSNGGTLTNGGGAFNGDVFIGYWESSHSNSVTVTGSGSRWDLLGLLRVGRAGGGNTFLVSDGGTVVSSNIFIGSGSGSNRVSVTGAGSTWETGTVTVGSGTNGENRLVVSDGARVSGDNASIGASRSSSNLLMVVGAGSTFSNSGIFTMGFHSNSNNLMVISNGGFVSSGTAYLPGNSSGSHDNRIIVSGSGSTWQVLSEFRLSLDGSNLSVTVSDGGTFDSGQSSIGYSSSSNQVVVSGPDSSWTVRSNLNVGRSASVNLLWITNGGRVSSVSGSLSSLGGNDNLAVVTGAGSVWSNQTRLRIGVSGDKNEVRVSDGGLVVATNLIIAGASPDRTNNWAHSDGGHLLIVNPAGTGLLNVNAGGLSLNGGSTVADHLLIDSNGVLRGNGPLTVANTVTNFGWIQPGQSIGALTLSSGVSLQSSGTVEFEIGGLVAGTGHDVFNVAGAAELGGALKLALTGGFYPAAGDSFVVMNYASASGAFANVASGARLNTADGLGSFLVNVGPTSLVVGNYISPDSDGDGQTDYAEFLAGTDTNDPNSALVITSFVANGVGHVVLRFPYAEGKSYRVLFCDNFPNGSWTAINSPVLSTPAPGFHEWVDDGSLTGGLNVSNRTYRIGLR
jgi:T5SS/PEP-CTERM-associated repeat protein